MNLVIWKFLLKLSGSVSRNVVCIQKEGGKGELKFSHDG